jgi:hypothetical protein
MSSVAGKISAILIILSSAPRTFRQKYPAKPIYLIVWSVVADCHDISTRMSMTATEMMNGQSNDY